MFCFGKVLKTVLQSCLPHCHEHVCIGQRRVGVLVLLPMHHQLPTSMVILPPSPRPLVLLLE